MSVYRHYETTYCLDNKQYSATLHIEQIQHDGRTSYKAVIDSSPLRGTFSACEESVEMALDFLNLAMQAEGADEIVFRDLPTEAAG